MSRYDDLRRMRQHIEELLVPHQSDDCDIVHWRPRGSCIVDDHGEIVMIVIPPIRSASSYAIALHEIGHLRGRHQQSRREIVRERWAWAWAREPRTGRLYAA
jgi:hypothetical protein